MKLLMVSPYLPSPTWGAATRSYYLLKSLSQQHEVSLLALTEVNDVENSMVITLLEKFTQNLQIVALPQSASKRLRQLQNLAMGRSYFLHLFISPEVQAALDVLLAREQYDAVLFETVLIAGYWLRSGVKCIIDQHNIEYELLRRTYQQETSPVRKWYSRLEYHLLRPLEIERCQQADIVLATSEEDRLILKRALPRNVIEVVPNGVDTDFFQNNSSEETSGQIVFTGTMQYYPNIQAVLFFAEQCWPLIKAQIPDATWLIVGRTPPPEVQRLADLPGVTVTGTVPRVQPYLSSSQVVIAPLLIGSGTRLKILEALAMQKAVVSTSVGCEGLAVEAGNHLQMVDGPEDFAEAVVTLLRDPEKRAALGAAGRALVESEYGWEQCGNRLLDILERTC